MTSILNFLSADKNFVSKPDLLLAKLDKKYPIQSKSQQKEIENYQKLFRERDKK